MAKKITVLLVEDNEMSRDMLSRRLEKADYSVTTAENAAQAREKIAEMPQVVLLDMMLPDETGWSLATEWKKSLEYSGIPIIAVSAMALRENVERGLQSGCDAYLTKPVDFKVLQEHIAELVAAK